MMTPSQSTARRLREAPAIEEYRWPAATPAPVRREAITETRESLPKRGLDILLAAGGLLVSMPVWLALAAAVKLEDGGPVFFGQERVGKGGRRFRSWKFRSMRPRCEDGTYSCAELEAERITRVGRVLRATALDELPQLWNILRGDMSFVGPRALLPEEVVGNGKGEAVRLEELPGYHERHSVQPGLTGLSQVHLPRDVSHQEKFRYDLLYVRRRSFLLDVKLIARSVWISLRGRWPHVGKNGRKETSDAA